MLQVHSWLQVYDLDRSGTLSRGELKTLLEEAYGGAAHMSKTVVKFNVHIQI